MTIIGVIILSFIYIAIDVSERLYRKEREAEGWI